jgi:hypothetical protein
MKVMRQRRACFAANVASEYKNSLSDDEYAYKAWLPGLSEPRLRHLARLSSSQTELRRGT